VADGGQPDEVDFDTFLPRGPGPLGPKNSPDVHTDFKRIRRIIPKGKKLSTQHVPTVKTRHTVSMLVAMGTTQEQISQIMSLGLSSLRKYYRHELETGLAQLNFNVANNLYNRAMGDDTAAVTASIFWLKTRAKFIEREERVNINDAAQVAKPVIKTGGFTPDQRALMREILLAAKEQGMIEAAKTAKALASPVVDEDDGDDAL